METILIDINGISYNIEVDENELEIDKYLLAWYSISRNPLNKMELFNGINEAHKLKNIERLGLNYQNEPNKPNFSLW